MDFLKIIDKGLVKLDKGVFKSSQQALDKFYLIERAKVEYNYRHSPFQKETYLQYIENKYSICKGINFLKEKSFDYFEDILEDKRKPNPILILSCGVMLFF